MTDDQRAPAVDQDRKKRPASQYYWGDWWKDKGLHSCSLAARGLWHEMNCLMHEGEPYGHLTLNGRPMTVAQLANQCRISPAQCSKLLRELEDAGVPSRTGEGVIYSRRMVRDEATRNARAAGGKEGAEHGAKGAEHGSKGGRPSGSKGGSETPLGVSKKPPPSSSSSSSSSSPKQESAEASPPPSARAFEARFGEPEPDPSPPPSMAGVVCAAMRQAGMASVQGSDPRLLALLAQGATVDEFAEAARAAVAKGKPWGWALGRVEGMRRDAASIALPASQPDPMAWRKTTDGVFAKGESLGLKVQPGEMFNDFERRVVAAFRRAAAAPQPSTA